MNDKELDQLLCSARSETEEASHILVAKARKRHEQHLKNRQWVKTNAPIIGVVILSTILTFITTFNLWVMCKGNLPMQTLILAIGGGICHLPIWIWLIGQTYLKEKQHEMEEKKWQNQ